MEGLLPLPALAAQLPKGRRGGPVHTATITRWIREGAKVTGDRRVKLRGVRLPGGWHTKQEWVEEFVADLTRAAMEASSPIKSDDAGPAKTLRDELNKKKLALLGI